MYGDVPEDREHMCGREQREEVDDGHSVTPCQVEQPELTTPGRSRLPRGGLVMDGKEEGGNGCWELLR